MVKILIVVASILLAGFVYFPPRVTGDNHYVLHSKNDRLSIVNELKQDCRSRDIAYLVVTYGEKYHDRNTSHCWSEYMKKCFSTEGERLEYKLETTCLVY